MQRTVRSLLWVTLFVGGAVSRVARAQDPGCDPGAKEIKGLAFVGNHAFSASELALRVNTTSSSWARRHLRILGTRRCLDSSELPRDVLRLRLLYRNAGYYGAQVDTVVKSLGKDAVSVAFRIREGRPIVVDSVAVTGLDSVPDARTLVKGLWLAVGKPFDRARYAADADTIVARLRNEGYPRAEFLPNYETRTDSFLARVTLDIVPGRRARIDSALIDVIPAAGKRQQIPNRVVARLLGISRGALYRDRDLIRAQRNLYQTGAYLHVEVAPLPDSLQPRGDSLIVLRIILREDDMHEIDTEVGWGTLDCFRTRAQLTDKNFLNGGRRLDLTGQLSKIAYGSPLASTETRRLCYSELASDPFSKEINYYLGATVRQPALFGTSAVPAFSIYSEQRGEFLAYLRTTRIGGEASLTKDIAAATSGRLGYSLEYGRTQAQQAVLCAVFSRCDAASQRQLTDRDRPLAIVSASVTRVRTDNEINPTLGSVLTGEVRSASRAFGSDPELTFLKGVADARWYHPLGWGNILALRLRAGAIAGGAGGLSGTRLPPPQERLYGGGATTVRGFQQNELGALIYLAGDTVHDTITIDGRLVEYRRVRGNVPLRIVPVGGNTLVVGNVDYRLRDPFFPELIQYTLFNDFGEVWSRGLLGFPFKLHWTPGVGVRVFSAVGPIQVNVGYNPYPLPAGPIFYEASPDKSGNALLYCVSPGYAQLLPQKVLDCPHTFVPAHSSAFLRKLTFTFSIGPDF